MEMFSILHMKSRGVYSTNPGFDWKGIYNLHFKCNTRGDKSEQERFTGGKKCQKLT